MAWGRLVAGAGVVLVLLGCAEPVKKPKPPDLRALDRAYRAPSGSFDAQSVGAVLAALDAKVKGLGGICGFQSASELFCKSGAAGCPLCAGLEPALRALGSLAGDDDAGTPAEADDLGSAVEGDGFVRITRICPGHLDQPSPDPAHGFIQLTVGFSEAGFDAVPFGRFDHCQLDVAGAHNTIDAELALSFGHSFRLSALDELAPVVRLRGEVATAAGRARLDSDLQVALSRDAGFSLLLEPEGVGEVVFVQSARGGGFRASNGSFLCADTLCENERGEQVTLP